MLPLWAQSLHLVKPAKGDPLDEAQEFVVEVVGPLQPQRMEIFLNGELMRARRQPPFRFTLSWNTRYRNLVAFVAHFDGREPIRLEKTFEQVAADVEAEIQAFQIWPFFERPQSKAPRVRYQRQTIEPQVFEKADTHRLSLVIALDVSGSMRDELDSLTKPLAEFIAFARKQNYELRFMVFDGTSRLLKIDEVLALPSLADLYRGVAHSTVWDGLATATGLFTPKPRRLLLFISDAADDGSRHSPRSATEFLRRSGAPMIWINLTDRDFGRMYRLARRSGGFELVPEQKPFETLRRRLEYQYHLLAPRAGFPVDLNGSQGSVWYPHWREP
ncbi:vWA domain-containing protein [Sulfidibacter corallicola]|uniref:VWA domain-containing protein n=1 Tax=Sulfidibacter corallicola TaxID=2818388 RepID=A0A8A4TT78_SULCO|nr:vWA domain-containing protein [Sulfidibacter corallicola]QTD52587.1 VWA domain-containing protein [Sulfidibacter corallicola]